MTSQPTSTGVLVLVSRPLDTAACWRSALPRHPRGAGRLPGRGQRPLRGPGCADLLPHRLRAVAPAGPRTGCTATGRTGQGRPHHGLAHRDHAGDRPDQGRTLHPAATRRAAARRPERRATGALLVVLAAALGVGAFIGPLLFGRLVDRLDSPVLLFIPYLVRGVIDAALAFLTGFWIPAALLLLYGINTSTGGVTYTTLLQRRVPAEYRGRVFSAFNMVWQAGRLASLALAGLVASRTSCPSKPCTSAPGRCSSSPDCSAYEPCDSRRAALLRPHPPPRQQ